MNIYYTRLLIILYSTALITSKCNSQDELLSFFSSHKYRLVQGISISEDGQSIYCTLSHREYQEFQNGTIKKDTPRLGIYQIKWENKQWSAPKFLSLTDSLNHYEPTLQPGTDILVFNASKVP